MSTSTEGEDTTGLLGIRIGIKRFGSSVQISFQCEGDYHAIEVYDRLVEAAQTGKVTIDLKER